VRCQLNNVLQLKTAELAECALVEYVPQNVVLAQMTVSPVKCVIRECAKPSAAVVNNAETQGCALTGCASKAATIAMTAPQMKYAQITDVQIPARPILLVGNVPSVRPLTMRSCVAVQLVELEILSQHASQTA